MRESGNPGIQESASAKKEEGRRRINVKCGEAHQ
jgi:hypothetical protein